MTEEEPGSDEICPVCNWQDDGVQFVDPSYWGGANVVSLETARQNFLNYGCSDLERADGVRPPFRSELPNRTAISGLSKETEEAVHNFLLAGENIEAVHWLRSEMNLNLARAKSIVDDVFSEFDYRGYARATRRRGHVPNLEDLHSGPLH